MVRTLSPSSIPARGPGQRCLAQLQRAAAYSLVRGPSTPMGTHHQDFLPKSLSAHEALVFRRYGRDISEAHFRTFWRQALPGMPAMLGPRSGLLFCLFCFCCGWLACCAVLAFCPLVFGPSGVRPSDPSHKTLLFTVFCCICVSGLACGLLFLGCSFWGLWRAQPAIP